MVLQISRQDHYQNTSAVFLDLRIQNNPLLESHQAQEIRFFLMKYSTHYLELFLTINWQKM
jgi:hypothetical protein